MYHICLMFGLSSLLTGLGKSSVLFDVFACVSYSLVTDLVGIMVVKLGGGPLLALGSMVLSYSVRKPCCMFLMFPVLQVLACHWFMPWPLLGQKALTWLRSKRSRKTGRTMERTLMIDNTGEECTWKLEIILCITKCLKDKRPTVIDVSSSSTLRYPEMERVRLERARQTERVKEMSSREWNVSNGCMDIDKPCGLSLGPGLENKRWQIIQWQSTTKVQVLRKRYKHLALMWLL